MLSKLADTYKHLLEEMKMTKLNKTMAALLSASLLIVGLAGCQKRDTAAGSSGSSGTSGTTSSGSSGSSGAGGSSGSSGSGGSGSSSSK